MRQFIESLRKEDKTILYLSRLYEQYGYKKYCMAKFEEYSLYSDYRDFLPSENIIAFNNLDGRLMALKPDVTLSIVKNAMLQSESFNKLYYNENVYRLAPHNHDYKEISQMGLELLGNIDLCATVEVLTLALKSLEQIDPRYLLCVSHMGFITGIMDEIRIAPSVQKAVLTCIKNKNMHELQALCSAEGVDADAASRLCRLAEISSVFPKVFDKLKPLVSGAAAQNAYAELEALYHAVCGTELAEHIILDFSVINNMEYYNGFVFQGYIEHIPTAVLAGGRYGRLAEKIRRGVDAIGFAVYLDCLNLYYKDERRFDTDVLLLYTDADDSAAVFRLTEQLLAQGLSVRTEKSVPEGYRAKTVYSIENGCLKEVSARA